jgi:hypothetical protein
VETDEQNASVMEIGKTILEVFGPLFRLFYYFRKERSEVDIALLYDHDCVNEDEEFVPLVICLPISFDDLKDPKRAAQAWIDGAYAIADRAISEGIDTERWYAIIQEMRPNG